MPERNSQRITKALESRILHGFACEWASACLMLPHELQLQMKKPLFRLSDMKKQLGTWSWKKKEVCISRSLVLNHPWDAVQEVLLHETAHQLATEVLGARDEPPHGPAFQHACHLLRANPKASGRYPTLHEAIRKQISRGDDKIMIRVKKLMALAESQNRHEAEAAMAKSRELIKKYNVDLLKSRGERCFKSTFLGNPALRHFREEYHLAHLVCGNYFVEGLWVPAYVLDKGKMGRVLEISGTVENLNIAGYVYDCVKNYIEREWAAYNLEKGLNRYRKTDFAVGIIEGFQEKLTAQEKQGQASDQGALMVVTDPALGEYMGYKYPRISRFTRGGMTQDTNVLDDGMAIGRKMVISRGISERGGGMGCAILKIRQAFERHAVHPAGRQIQVNQP